jgi:hypothetical protein
VCGYGVSKETRILAVCKFELGQDLRQSGAVSVDPFAQVSGVLLILPGALHRTARAAAVLRILIFGSRRRAAGVIYAAVASSRKGSRRSNTRAT